MGRKSSMASAHLQHRRTLNIAVVGAGIGGLAAAIGLLHDGHRVTIFEAASSLQSVSRQDIFQQPQ